MAVIMIEGWDKYGPAGISANTTTNLATLLTQGEWTTAVNNGANGTLALVAGLSSTGQALNITTGGAINGTTSGVIRTLPGNYTRLIGGVRIQPTNASGVPLWVNFRTAAGGTQCTITVNTSGTISLLSGGTGNATTGSGSFGLTLGTSVLSITTSSIHYLEWDIACGASGAYTLYIDGVSWLTGSGNTNHTGGGTFGSIYFGADRTGTGNFDDFYLFDTTGLTNNAVLLTSPRVETTYPTSDVQTQFTNGQSIVGDDFCIAGSVAPGANELFLRKVTPGSTMTLNSVNTFVATTSVTAKFKALLYPDNAGTPNAQALIASGVETVGCTSGALMTSTFASPPTLTGGTSYWIGFMGDTSINIQATDNSLNGVKAAATYASGPPATCPTVTTNQFTLRIYGACTGSTVNWDTENLNPAIGDVSYITSSTAGNEDLYGFAPLQNTPTTIYTVAVKGNVRRADTGPRTVDLRMKSGTADSAGSNAGQTPGTGYQWLDSFFDTDPNTVGNPWTGSTLNAASSGVKIAT